MGVFDILISVQVVSHTYWDMDSVPNPPHGRELQLLGLRAQTYPYPPHGSNDVYLTGRSGYLQTSYELE